MAGIPGHTVGMVALPHHQPIPFITLPNWVKAAARCGFNIEPVFAELGIATDLLNVETATIEPPLLLAVMQRCVQLSRRHHFPFVLGESFDFTYLPDLETFVTTSPTLRDAVQVFAWVRELINPMLDVTLEERGDTARLVLRFVGIADEQAPPWMSETMFASVMRFGRMLLGDDMPFDRLCVRHPAPAHAAAYAEYFRSPVVFGAADNALEYSRALLDRPLPGGYSALHIQARQRVERRLGALPRRGRCIAEVERLCLADPALLTAGVAAVAQRMDLHPRTLQRRLLAEGERYASLQARLRCRLAQQWLAEPHCDVETVSERLGFSDRRSFTRAFARWTGQTPSAFRQSGLKR